MIWLAHTTLFSAAPSDNQGPSEDERDTAGEQLTTAVSLLTLSPCLWACREMVGTCRLQLFLKSLKHLMSQYDMIPTFLTP